MDMRESGFLVRDLSLYRHGCGGGRLARALAVEREKFRECHSSQSGKVKEIPYITK